MLLKDPKAEIYMSFVAFMLQISIVFSSPPNVFANGSSTLANLSAIGSSLVCNCLLLDKVIKESLLEEEGKSALAKRLKEI